MLILRFMFITLLLSTLSCSDRMKSDEFVQVQGTQLIRNGKPYYFVGANMWYGAYLGSPGSTGDRPRLLRELDSLKSYGIINLRVLASSEESSIGRSVTPAFQPEPGVYDDSLLIGLDFLLTEMAKRDMQAVLYLTNYWEWSGGMAQYNVWTGAGTVNPEDTTQGWGMFMDFAASFYSNEASVELYNDYIRMLVTRRNTIHNRLYVEDPTIMSWQLANEPRPGSTPDSVMKHLPAFYSWIDETAKLIHELDPNHLVSSGSEGTVGTFQSEEYYIEAYKTPHIDFLNFHLWAYNWGWFDPKRWRETLPTAEQNAIAYINQQIGLARKLGKPTVMDEFGLGRDGGVIYLETSTNARDTYYRTILQVIEDSARAGAPIAGTNFWAWGGEGKALNPDGMWKRGDPFVGDPPQEPQGQNSVFASDSSTLRIIGEYAKRMMEIGAGIVP